MAFEIDLRNDQTSLAVDDSVVRRAVAVALHAEQVKTAVISITIVDNATIHRLNREYLQHDYPTDVISFALGFLADEDDEDEDEDSDTDDVAVDRQSLTNLPSLSLPAAGAVIEGEIIASAEMACQMATEYAWEANSELLLYVVHGVLHLCGYDDLTPEDQTVMRQREREILGVLGLTGSGR